MSYNTPSPLFHAKKYYIYINITMLSIEKGGFYTLLRVISLQDEKKSKGEVG